METLNASVADKAAIKAIMSALVDAWNVHDAKTYAALFTEESDFVNVMGLWMQGRSEIERGHAQVFATFLSESHLTIQDIQSKFLKPDVAILHCTWEIEGQKSPDGNHSLQSTGVWTAITIRQGNTWKIAALQNTGKVSLANPDLPPIH